MPKRRARRDRGGGELGVEKEFAVLPYDEFLNVQETLQDYEDLMDLREAKVKEQRAEGYNLAQTKAEWGV